MALIVCERHKEEFAVLVFLPAEGLTQNLYILFAFSLNLTFLKTIDKQKKFPYNFSCKILSGLFRIDMSSFCHTVISLITVWFFIDIIPEKVYQILEDI